MTDIKAALVRLSERSTPGGSERLRERVQIELTEPSYREPRWQVSSWVVAATVASAVFVLIGGAAILLGGSDGLIVPLPPSESETTVVTTVSTTEAPDVQVLTGRVTVDISELVGSLGDELAGVLMAYSNLDDPELAAEGRWRGVAGFAVEVDADPFSTSQVLGVVESAFPEDPSSGMWPWASGEAEIPAGDYTLWLWTGTDYCCYNRWKPADTPGLRGCEFQVSASGEDQTIHIKDIPDEGPCATEPATATTGTINLSVENLSGMEGYRLLAGVWSETHDPSLVGGSFWTIIDRDPFTDTDLVHPAAFPNPRTEVTEVEGWGAEDYLWDLTAQLEPGTYRVSYWANPGELKPYGSHIPAEFIERRCDIAVNVAAGYVTDLIVTEMPRGDLPCTYTSHLWRGEER
jgi:hypothetical protein